MTKPIILPESPICQAVASLREIADGLHYGELDSQWQTEKIARLLSTALANIDDRITALEQFDANRVYVARLEEELAESRRSAELDIRWDSSSTSESLELAEALHQPHFPDLDSLVSSSCPKCSSEYDVIGVSNRFFARCVSPKCELHGALIPVSRWLALAWNDLARAEDTAYAEAEENERT